MKIPMPEPEVSRDGTVSLHGQICGRIWRHDSGGGWWARVATDHRKDGMAIEASGMLKRWHAVRWLVIQVVDWRAP